MTKKKISHLMEKKGFEVVDELLIEGQVSFRYRIKGSSDQRSER